MGLSFSPSSFCSRNISHAKRAMAVHRGGYGLPSCADHFIIWLFLWPPRFCYIDQVRNLTFPRPQRKTITKVLRFLRQRRPKSFWRFQHLLHQPSNRYPPGTNLGIPTWPCNKTVGGIHSPSLLPPGCPLCQDCSSWIELRQFLSLWV